MADSSRPPVVSSDGRDREADQKRELRDLLVSPEPNADVSHIKNHAKSCPQGNACGVAEGSLWEIKAILEGYSEHRGVIVCHESTVADMVLACSLMDPRPIVIGHPSIRCLRLWYSKGV